MCARARTPLRPWMVVLGVNVVVCSAMMLQIIRLLAYTSYACSIRIYRGVLKSTLTCVMVLTCAIDALHCSLHCGVLY